MHVQENVLLMVCDVSDLAQVKETGQKARETFGPVTILVNNAGIVSGKPILEISDQMMKKTLEVNTLAHLYTIREFLPDMIRLNKGHVVSICSLAGVLATPG
jgi:all-trans-retinol dehydrogenase (NAD+)